jgi:catechol-2,3-dioxygenase
MLRDAMKLEGTIDGGSAMPPTKLSHVVFQTNRKKDMQDWYCDVLEGHVAYEDTHLGFMTYDDEHHRVAFVDLGPLIPRDRDADMAVSPTDAPGVHHVAFTFGSMGELLGNYVRLAARGIRPFYSINHGPTTSLYYSDPDGNRVELLVDNFATAEEGQAWMRSPAFERNPIGVAFDPDELVRRFRSGVPVAELVIRDA